MLQKNRNILIHITGSFLFLSLPFIFSPDFFEQNSDHVYFNFNAILRPFSATCILLLFFYLNYYLFIPRFYITKKYSLFILLVFISFLCVLFIPELFIAGKKMLPEIPKQHFSPHRPPRKNMFGLQVNHHLFQFLGVLVFSLLLKIRERLKQTETEKVNAEISYLKAQINPHFLFNTLNSIYSLAILKSEKTASAVVKLSDMMRYVLNDSNIKFVLLEKELNYISNYIDLQRMRLTSNVKLNYDCEGNIFDKQIAPLVIIPFIENAFKHGVNSEEDSEIDIRIVISETELKLIVKNNCVTTNNNTLNKSGLGIENTKQRLNLLYPQSHTLNIIEKDNIFTVVLILNIHD